MTNAELLRSLAQKDERITELQAEILELRMEKNVEPLARAIEIVNECRKEDTTIDYDKLSAYVDEYTELISYLSTYILYHDEGLAVDIEEEEE